MLNDLATLPNSTSSRIQMDRGAPKHALAALNAGEPRIGSNPSGPKWDPTAQATLLVPAARAMMAGSSGVATRRSDDIRNRSGAD